MVIEHPDPRCPNCGAYLDYEDFDKTDGTYECPNCGYDGTPDYCLQCDAQIKPKNPRYGTSLCERCWMEQEEEAME